MVCVSVFLLPVSASADIGDNSSGINVHVPHTSLHLVDKAASLGAQWIRVDGNWEIFERRDVADVPVDRRNPQVDYRANEYSWEVMDRVVCRAHEQGLNVFMTLGYSPCWAVEGGADCNQRTHERKPIPGKFDAFVFAAVRHYADGVSCPGGMARVTHFGMWNEANLDGFYENGDVPDYVTRILVPGAAAVRAACPDCLVLGPDLANVGDDADDVIEDVLCHPQGQAALDIYTHHSYHGFAELGHRIWDGDSYDNALDEQRFWFTRRSLRQVMEQCDATHLEVWMTETGQRAPGTGPADNPSFDRGELEHQAEYVRLVLRAQARRSWVTNTFIYEIVDDTFSNINGYGLWRCAQGPQGFTEPCYEKPSVGSFRDFIDAHPEFQSNDQPDPACSNGRDDDEDGLTDFPEDPGCDSEDDEDEFNRPPPPVLEVPRAPRLVVDGAPDEYGTDALWLLGPADFEAVEAQDVPSLDDLAASIRVRRVGDRIGFFVEVVDDIFDNGHGAAELWRGDSLQIAWDPDGSGGESYGEGDVEIGIAMLRDGPVAHAFHGRDPGLEGPVVIWRGQSTLYEFSLPIDTLFQNQHPGGEAGFALLVNEADNQGREGWLAFADGIGRFKRPNDFGRLRLVDRLDDPGQSTPDEDPVEDAGVDVDPPEDGSDQMDTAQDQGSDGSSQDDGSVLEDTPEEEDVAQGNNGNNDNNGNPGNNDNNGNPGNNDNNDNNGADDGGGGGDDDDGCTVKPGSPSSALPLLLLFAALAIRRY